MSVPNLPTTSDRVGPVADRLIHTPGPWRIERFEDSPHVRIQPATETTHGGSLADVYNNDANARLIASAPDLLEALRATIPIIRAWHDMAGTLSDDDKATAWRIYSTQSPEMRRITAALAKAEGAA